MLDCVEIYKGREIQGLIKKKKKKNQVTGVCACLCMCECECKALAPDSQGAF